MMTITYAHANDGEAPVINNDTFWKATSGSYIYSQGGGIFRFPDAQGKEHYYWYGAKYQEAVDKRIAAPSQGIFLMRIVKSDGTLVNKKVIQR